MRFRILGQLDVRNECGPVEVPRGRGRLLLTLLLVHGNETVSKDRLVDALWGESPPPTATRSLHNQVSALRKALGDGRLITEARGYRLVVADGECDAERFETLAAQGRAALADGDAQRAADALHSALALWRGPAFGDLAHETALARDAAELEERRLAATEDRIDADLALGRDAGLAAELDRLVAENRLRERLRGQQMLALYRAGRQADALAVYAAARRRLVDELGIEPGPALRELERAILEQDPSLAPPYALPRGPRAVSLRGARLPWHLTVAGVLLMTVAIASALIARDTGSGGPAADAGASGGDLLVVIDPADNRVVDQATVGRTPTSVASGGGAVWTLNAGDRTISRVDLRTKAVRTFTSDSSPVGIAADADGVWVGQGPAGVRRDAGSSPTTT